MASDLRRGFQLGPDLRALDADGGPQKREERCESVCASSIQAMRKPSRRLDALRGVILHADEDDEAVAWRLDAVVEDAEERPDAEGLDLLLDEALCATASECAGPHGCRRLRCRAEGCTARRGASAKKWHLPEPRPPYAPL